MTKRIDALIADASKVLASSSDSARLDSEVLLCHLIEQSRSYLFTWPERELDDETCEAFLSLLARRVAGEPIAHIVGKREFWGLSFNVSASTLIPRPDTELLVEQTLELFSRKDAPHILDLGTGTGAIACSIASELPLASVIAVDVVAEAVTLAQQNVAELELNNVSVTQSNWFSSVNKPPAGFDAIISNPPYIEDDDHHLTEGDVRFEPLSALVSGDEGLADIKMIALEARDYLKAGGFLLVEHGWKQGKSVFQIFDQLCYKNIKVLKDLAGNDRATIGYF